MARKNSAGFWPAFTTSALITGAVLAAYFLLKKPAPKPLPVSRDAGVNPDAVVWLVEQEED